MEKIDKINKYIEIGWWNGVEKRHIEGWLKNFKDKKEIGELILDNVIFYSDEQLTSYTRCIVNEIQADIYRKDVEENKSYQDDEYYNELWKKYCRNMRIMPAATSNDAGSSAYEVVRRYRKIFGDDMISSIDQIPSLLTSQQVNEFIFVDEFSGSGNQIKTFLQNNITIEGKAYRLYDLLEAFQNIKITVALYVIHKDALGVLKREFPKLRVRYIDLIDNGLDFMNLESTIYNNLDREERNKIIRYISVKRDEIIKSETHYRKMGKYEKNIPIVFQKRCPNNALILLFAKSGEWNSLFELGE